MLVLNCRRCESDLLLALVRLDGSDHTVYRCRSCGFLFSPPDDAATSAADVALSPLRPAGEVYRRRQERVAAAYRRPAVEG